jgi:hypothetical protein
MTTTKSNYQGVNRTLIGLYKHVLMRGTPVYKCITSDERCFVTVPMMNDGNVLGLKTTYVLYPGKTAIRSYHKKSKVFMIMEYFRNTINKLINKIRMIWKH